MISNLKANPIPNPKILLPITCNTQTATVFPQILWISEGLSSVQMMKSKNVIPTCESWVKVSDSAKTPGKRKEIMIPARIYPIIIGCLRIFIAPSERRTIPRITANERKN